MLVTAWPLVTEIALTVPSWAATISFSSFIASNINKVWPFLTVSPTATSIFKIVPAIGDKTGVSPADLGASTTAGFSSCIVWFDSVTLSSSGELKFVHSAEDKNVKLNINVGSYTQQSLYITLPKNDYIEPAAEEVIIEEEQSWIQGIINTVSNIFK